MRALLILELRESAHGDIECKFRPWVYESRGKLQIQLLCGADDTPRRRMNTERYDEPDPGLTLSTTKLPYTAGEPTLDAQRRFTETIGYKLCITFHGPKLISSDRIEVLLFCKCPTFQ